MCVYYPLTILIFQGFPQREAIRDNLGYFHTETFYPGGSGNTIVQGLTQETSTVHQHINPAPTTVSLEREPIVVSSPIRETIVRSVQNRRVESALTDSKTTTTLRPLSAAELELSEEELQNQAKSAYYKFGTSVRDTINDHEHVRQEVREGLAVTGMYSYSDGFFRRTVYYTADEGGYRVTNEEIEPIGNGEGPKFNPKGQADIKSSLSGNYAITVDDFKLNKRQEQQIQNQLA